MLTEQAAEQGLETESWTVDAAEAPRERDWIDSQKETTAELYFDSEEHARSSAKILQGINQLLIGGITEQKPEDWDAKWKASFLNSSEGIVVPPFWRILPPWSSVPVNSGEHVLRINPGAGFGTGTHETTQLCLGAIADSWLAVPRSCPGVLDFGSGSGILAIAAAKLGALVHAVEIDTLAIDNAIDNARLNELEGRIEFQTTFKNLNGPYGMVIANILKPVLLEFAEPLVKRMAPKGILILSGLIEKDLDTVSERFSELLGFTPVRRELNEWRALIWVRS